MQVLWHWYTCVINASVFIVTKGNVLVIWVRQWHGLASYKYSIAMFVKFVVPLPDKKKLRMLQASIIISYLSVHSAFLLYMLQRETSPILSSSDFLFWNPPNFYLLGDFLRHFNAIVLVNLFVCISLHHQLRAGFCQLSARIHWVKWLSKCVRLSVSRDFAALNLIV